MREPRRCTPSTGRSRKTTRMLGKGTSSPSPSQDLSLLKISPERSVAMANCANGRLFSRKGSGNQKTAGVRIEFVSARGFTPRHFSIPVRRRSAANRGFNQTPATQFWGHLKRNVDKPAEWASPQHALREGEIGRASNTVVRINGMRSSYRLRHPLVPGNARVWDKGRAGDCVPETPCRSQSLT